MALALFLNPDPQEDTFGTIRFRRMDGAVLVASDVDGEDVREREVGMVLTYPSGLSVGITTFLREEIKW